MPELLTIADLERLIGKPRHQINYALQRFGPPPRGRVAGVRTWSHEDVEAITGAIEMVAGGARLRRPEEADA